MFQQLRNLGQSVKTGFKKGVATQDQLADERFGKNNRNVVASLYILRRWRYYQATENVCWYYKLCKTSNCCGWDLTVGDDALLCIGDHITSQLGQDCEQIVGDNIYSYNSAQRAAIKLGGLVSRW